MPRKGIYVIWNFRKKYFWLIIIIFNWKSRWAFLSFVGIYFSDNFIFVKDCYSKVLPKLIVCCMYEKRVKDDFIVLKCEKMFIFKEIRSKMSLLVHSIQLGSKTVCCVHFIFEPNRFHCVQLFLFGTFNNSISDVTPFVLYFHHS